MSGASLTAGIGASVYRFWLRSKCTNGKSGTAEVVAVGPSIGVDIKGPPPFSTTASGITLNDRLTTVDPNVFNGWFTIYNAGIALGPGYGCSVIQLGGNGMPLASPGQSGAWSASCGAEFGMELGIGATPGIGHRSQVFN
jgi:hypothetical protein